MHRARRLPAGAEGNADNSGEGAQLAEDWPRPDTTAAHIVSRNTVVALVELAGVRLVGSAHRKGTRLDRVGTHLLGTGAVVPRGPGVDGLQVEEVDDGAPTETFQRGIHSLAMHDPTWPDEGRTNLSGLWPMVRREAVSGALRALCGASGTR
jgi:hypothetical protein